MSLITLSLCSLCAMAAVLLSPGPASADTGGLTATSPTSTRNERLWLLGGVAVTITAAGVIAKVATRGSRHRDS
ncbi:hypothetical protein V1460_03115 [Streptomyces sp. SCSIO 30461]|uniref:hypothetical protein n=1 Tax=Streptomyces sp. SCSIO 30461 TaxID=3118085 RepID=UPI0030D1A46A